MSRVNLVLLWFVALSGPVAWGGDGTQSDLYRPATALAAPRELLNVARTVISRNGVPGAGLAVVSSHAVEWAAGVGTTGCTGGDLVTENTLFRVGSISKTAIALAIMKLVEKGRLTLDAKLSDIVPDARIVNPWEQSNPVRLLHVLDHTAGFDDMLFSEVYAPDQDSRLPLGDVLRKFDEPLKVRWPPGTRMSYSNTGYGLLGYMIERVTGRSFEEYVRAEVLRPLGMYYSNFELGPGMTKLLASGCRGVPAQAVPFRHIYLRPAGDLISSPAEFAKLLQMLLQRGVVANGDRFLRAASIQTMEEARSSAAARVGVVSGYGLGISTSVDFPVLTRTHGGAIDGFVSLYRYVPGSGRGYLIFVNTATPGAAVGELDRILFAYVTGGANAERPPRAVVASGELESNAGTFMLATPRNQQLRFLTDITAVRKVYRVGDALFMRDFLRPPERLWPVSSVLFRRAHESSASTAFLKDGGSRAVMSDANGNYYEKVNPAWPVARLAFLGITALLMLSQLIFGPVLLFAGRYRRSLPTCLVGAHVALFLAALTLFGAMLLFPQISSAQPMSPSTIWIYIFTFLFPTLSAAGLVLGITSWRTCDPKRAPTYALSVALDFGAVGAYFATYDMMPLKLWVS